MTDSNPSSDFTQIGTTLSESGRVIKMFSSVVQSKPNPNEDTADDADDTTADDDDNSLVSCYSCNYCHSFGMEGCLCDRCDKDAGCYYVGEKMTEETIKKAIQLMKEEDEENEKSDSDSDSSEDDL